MSTSAEPGCFSVPVYHVLNPHRSPSWRQTLEWPSMGPGSNSFKIVSASAWMELPEAALAANPTPNVVCQGLAGM
ncbi:hypothetical protein ANO14919_024930 [Xylariales sp. No.14919]|nr:hypothetical protein ANO14919_024930 [Xylariales sp. No.14919]